MPSIVIKEYPYGHPKNEDYAYDVERQRQVDAEQEAEERRAALVPEPEGV